MQPLKGSKMSSCKNRPKHPVDILFYSRTESEGETVNTRWVWRLLWTRMQAGRQVVFSQLPAHSAKELGGGFLSRQPDFGVYNFLKRTVSGGSQTCTDPCRDLRYLRCVKVSLHFGLLLMVLMRYFLFCSLSSSSNLLMVYNPPLQFYRL